LARGADCCVLLARGYVSVSAAGQGRPPRRLPAKEVVFCVRTAGRGTKLTVPNSADRLISEEAQTNGFLADLHHNSLTRIVAGGARSTRFFFFFFR